MRWIVVMLLLANLLAWYWFSGMQAQRFLREQKQLVSSQAAARPIGANRLVLLAEASMRPDAESDAVLNFEAVERQIAQPNKPVQPDKKPDIEAASASVKTKSVCTLIGPFPDTQSAESLQRSLRVVGADVSLLAKDITTSVDYWVYLPPLPSPRAANRLFQELQNKKIDSYIFPGGDLENGISLGVFGKEENAIRHRNNIQERGYDAKMREIPRISREYWLDIQAPETMDLASFFEEGLPDGLEQQPEDCEPKN